MFGNHDICESCQQRGKRLRVPDSITLSPLPAYLPELNPMENIWDYLRGNKLSRGVWNSYQAIVAACRDAWHFLVNDPDRIRARKSIGVILPSSARRSTTAQKNPGLVKMVQPRKLYLRHIALAAPLGLSRRRVVRKVGNLLME